MKIRSGRRYVLRDGRITEKVGKPSLPEPAWLVWVPSDNHLNSDKYDMYWYYTNGQCRDGISRDVVREI